MFCCYLLDVHLTRSPFYNESLSSISMVFTREKFQCHFKSDTQQKRCGYLWTNVITNYSHFKCHQTNFIHIINSEKHQNNCSDSISLISLYTSGKKCPIYFLFQPFADPISMVDPLIKIRCMGHYLISVERLVDTKLRFLFQIFFFMLQI